MLTTSLCLLTRRKASALLSQQWMKKIPSSIFGLLEQDKGLKSLFEIDTIANIGGWWHCWFGEEFTYLGSIQSSSSNPGTEYIQCIGLAASAVKRIDCIWSQSKLSVAVKLRVCSTCVLSVLLCGSGAWALARADWKRLDSFHLRCQQRILHISWYDFVSNDEVLHRSGLFNVSYIIRKQRLGLFGHVARLQSDAPANQILRICTKMRDRDRTSQEWRRASGHPPTTWIH